MTPRSGSSSASGPPADLAPAFEDTLAELESIVDRLEGGELALEEALQAFEQGVGLARALAGRLSEAEQRVDVLLRDGDEALLRPLAVQDFDDPGDDA